MDYKYLTAQDELNLLRSRQAKLEVEFYEYRILLAEAEFVGSKDEAKNIAQAMASIEARHQLLSDKIDALLEGPQEDSEESEEDEEEAP